MTFAYWCVVFAMFLPLIWVGVAKVNGTGYDNSKPRTWLAQLDGIGQRANWAQQNAYEAFPPFAAAVIIAHLTGAPQTMINVLAGVFLLARITPGVMYILDKPTFRSLIWLVGFGCTVALFLIGNLGRSFIKPGTRPRPQGFCWGWQNRCLSTRSSRHCLGQGGTSPR